MNALNDHAVFRLKVWEGRFRAEGFGLGTQQGEGQLVGGKSGSCLEVDLLKLRSFCCGET